MRRIVTWLLVGAVVALGAAAGVDALRGGKPLPAAAEPDARPKTTTRAVADVPQPGPAEELREAGIRGVLTYADQNCRVHAVTLPELESHPAPVDESCRFTVASPDVVSFGRALPDPGLFLTARCRRGSVEVRTSDAHLLARHPGCAPAWRRDGLLSLVRDGDVVVLSGPLAQREYVHERVVLSKADVVRELRGAGWVDYRFALQETIWLPARRIAAIVRARSPEGAVDLLTVFSGRRLVSEPGFGYTALHGLRPSPSGDFVAAHIGDPGGLAVVDRDGRPVRLPLPYGNAVTWSPDERWIAEATDEDIVFFRADERNPRPIVVPIVARDLVWR